MSKINKGILKNIWLIVVILVTWQIVQRNSTNPYFPSPLRIFEVVKPQLNSGWILSYLIPTVKVFVCGFIGGTALGVIAGSLLTLSRNCEVIVMPIANFIRSIPSVAKIPLFIALFGLGTSSRIATVAFTVFFQILLVTVRSIKDIDSNFLDVARLLKFKPIVSLVRVKLPASAPSILIGVQSAMNVALLVTVASEILGSFNGIGAYISHAQAVYQIANIWFACFVLGILGILLNALILGLGILIVPWRREGELIDG